MRLANDISFKQAEEEQKAEARRPAWMGGADAAERDRAERMDEV